MRFVPLGKEGTGTGKVDESTKVKCTGGTGVGTVDALTKVDWASVVAEVKCTGGTGMGTADESEDNEPEGEVTVDGTVDDEPEGEVTVDESSNNWIWGSVDESTEVDWSSFLLLRTGKCTGEVTVDAEKVKGAVDAALAPSCSTRGRSPFKQESLMQRQEKKNCAGLYRKVISSPLLIRQRALRKYFRGFVTSVKSFKEATTVLGTQEWFANLDKFPERRASIHQC